MSDGHVLPVGLAAAAAAGAGEGSPPAPEPSAAERARTLVEGRQRGALATLSAEGFPFGSVATYAVDEAGRPLLFVSQMAEHTRNAAGDPRASLLVTEPVPEGTDPLAMGRVTLVGPLLPVVEAQRAEVRDRYLGANPSSAYYIDFADFGFWRLEVTSVRWVGGYGRMGWIDTADYAAAEPDPLAGEAARGILAHMNADHAEALIDMVRSLGGRPGAEEAEMTAVDRYGFDVLAAGPDGRGVVRIGFPDRLTDLDGVRPAMVRLVRSLERTSGPDT